MPNTPNKLPPTVMEKITHKGFKPVLSPKILGPRKRPSNCCITRIKIAKNKALIGLVINININPTAPPT